MLRLILMIVLSLFLPPVAVFFKVGIGFHFWLNIILTILGIVPGQIHAIFVTLTGGKLI